MDGVQAQTTMQTAMLRERACTGSTVVSGGSAGNTRPAGKPTRDSPNARDTPWGCRGPATTSGHRGEGVRPELRARYADVATAPCAEHPKYALGMESSVVFSAPLAVDANGEPAFVAAAYPRHLGGGEPPKPSNPGPVAMVSDRSPDALMERRRRRHLHGLLTRGPSGKAFNRRILSGSLSE
jgi:hypothetical protein